MSRLVIGSRGSRLALTQAEDMMGRLRQALPHLEISLVKIKTQGDRDRSSPLDQIGGRGVFVKELEDALLRDEIDIAVHSLKDMPSELDQRLRLAAVPERRDHRDALISRSGKTLAQLPPGARIGTGSQRRALELKAFRPDLEVCSIRGNVDTRVKKVLSGEMDGTILAAAALERMGWEDKITEYLPIELFLPMACQGALGVEVKADTGAAAHAAVLNDEVSWQVATAERSFLLRLGGGCHSAIAALARVTNGSIHLEALVGGLRSGKLIRTALTGSTETPEELGLLVAEKILEMGGAELIEEVQTPAS